MTQKPLVFYGVPLVRIIKIGPAFATSKEALEQAPILCEF